MLHKTHVLVSGARITPQQANFIQMVVLSALFSNLLGKVDDPCNFLDSQVPKVHIELNWDTVFYEWQDFLRWFSCGLHC